MFPCPICKKEFETGPKLGGHVKSHKKDPNVKYIPVSKKTNSLKSVSFCKFCNVSFAPSSIGIHTISCKSNPKYLSYLEKRGSSISLSMKGRKLSETQKENITSTITQKIKNGTWHLSYSKAKIVMYNGTKLHGTWEVGYAKYLDAQGLSWRRPNEKFEYMFEGKVRHYTPDFYVDELQSYVEIKGYATAKDEAKWSQFTEKLLVLRGENLVELGILLHSQVKK